MAHQETVEDEDAPHSVDSDAIASEDHDSKREPRNITTDENVVDFSGPDDLLFPSGNLGKFLALFSLHHSQSYMADI